MSGFAQGGTAIKDGGNLKIRGVSPTGVAAQGQVIWRAGWQLLATGTAAAPNTITAAINTTGANLLVVLLVAGTPPPITDSEHNVWTLAISGGTGSWVSIYYCTNPITSASHTVSTTGIAAFCVLSAFRWPASIVLDQISSTPSIQGSTIQLPAITPSTANSLLVTGVGLNANVVSVSAGFNIMARNDYVSAIVYGGAAAYSIQGAPVSASPVWTFSASTFGAAAIASFKPS